MKLNRFLYHHTRHGKRELRKILAAGRVRVDGVTEKDSQREINDFTQVHLDDVLLREKIPCYIMLHKPAGYLSATTDPVHPTVMDLINEPHILHIAGRLDRATTGLLILTNDGKWSRDLTEPKQKIPKTYLVDTENKVTEQTKHKFQEGIYFAYENITTSPANLEIISDHLARLTIYEGRYHQVKRMFHAVGNRVTSLHRESVGHIILDSQLKPGEYRALTPEEIQS